MASDTEYAGEDPLRSIIGEKLTAVTFIHDYVQLQFDSSLGLTALSTPSVYLGGSTLTLGDHGYRDALCARIERRIIGANVTEGEEIKIEFDDRSCISVSLMSSQRSGPEAAVFHDGSKTWVW
jgi:hypothetical protein